MSVYLHSPPKWKIVANTKLVRGLISQPLALYAQHKASSHISSLRVKPALLWHLSFKAVTVRGCMGDWVLGWKVRMTEEQTLSIVLEKLWMLFTLSLRSVLICWLASKAAPYFASLVWLDPVPVVLSLSLDTLQMQCRGCTVWILGWSEAFGSLCFKQHSTLGSASSAVLLFCLHCYKDCSFFHLVNSCRMKWYENKYSLEYFCMKGNDSAPASPEPWCACFRWAERILLGNCTCTHQWPLSVFKQCAPPPLPFYFYWDHKGQQGNGGSEGWRLVAKKSGGAPQYLLLLMAAAV